MSKKVTILSKSTSISSTPVGPGKTYPLSVLDHAMEAHSVHMVFYYRNIQTMTRPMLNLSLSETLSHYPAITGRLMRDGDGRWVVRCNDAGVRVKDAKVEMGLNEWFETATAEDEKALTVWDEMGEDTSIWSPFNIQINRFTDDSVAIGLSLPHMHADPSCAVLFVKAWADLHRRSYIVHPPFFHPPGLSPRPTPSISPAVSSFFSSKSSMSSLPSKSPMSSATFCFSDLSVKSLIADSENVTPFDALAALFWAAVSVPKITVCIEFRKSMHAPLPHGFYGNALHFSSVEADSSSRYDNLVSVVHDHIAGIEEEEFWSEVDWFEANKKESGFQMYGPEMCVVRMDAMMGYGVEFVVGEKPQHVALRLGGVEEEGVVVVMPGKEEGMARNVAVTMPESVMEKVCRDVGILKLGPKIMFRG